MSDLFAFAEKAPYGSIYEALGELRELFHREGRIDDSNAKLDAILIIGSWGSGGSKVDDEVTASLRCD